MSVCAQLSNLIIRQLGPKMKFSPHASANRRSLNKAIGDWDVRKDFTQDDSTHSALRDSKFFRKDDPVRPVVSSENFCGDSLSECGPAMGGTAHMNSATLVLHIRNVVCLGSFKQMARIKARWVVAGMKALRFWPATIGDEERDPMNEHELLAIWRHGYATVATPSFVVRPEQAVVASDRSNLLGKPLVKIFGGKLSVRHCLSSLERCGPFRLSQRAALSF